MNVEQIEHELNQIDGKNVVLIRPYFGHVSVSTLGELKVCIPDTGPMTFNVISQDSILFDAHDVERVEPNPFPNAEREVALMIRLKGPNDHSLFPQHV